MIGVFDSGVGGITVARAIEQHCPGYPLVYLGDIARTPYGTKSPATIEAYSRRNTEFLLDQGARLIVIACNTAASIAGSLLRQQIATPIIDVVQPAVASAASSSASGRFGVIGTPATVRSGIYQRWLKQLRPDAVVHTVACPLLVPLVEEGWLNRRETKMIVRRYLHPLRNRQIDTLVLGCTHYPLLKHIIGPRIGQRVRLIDSSVEVARTLRQLLDSDTNLADSLYHPEIPSRFYVTDRTDSVQRLAETVFGRSLHLETTDV
jgi:glutamate racemase